MKPVRVKVREIIVLPNGDIDSFYVHDKNRPFTNQYALYTEGEKRVDVWLRDVPNNSAYPAIAQIEAITNRWIQIDELGGDASEEMITELMWASVMYAYKQTQVPEGTYTFGDCEGMCAIAMDLPKGEGTLAQYIIDEGGVHEFYRFCIGWGKFLNAMFAHTDGLMFTEYTDKFCDWLEDPSKDFVHSAEALLNSNYDRVSDWLRSK